MSLYLLMVAFQVKHYLADFPLQTVYMLGKGKKGTSWILPLVSHAGVHAALTALIIGVYKPSDLWLAFVDFTLHFIIDRIKATYKIKDGPWLPEEKGELLGKYYAALGKDQMAHHLTYILIMYIMS